MKFLFLFILLPFISVGQTVHVKDEKIVYEGKEKISSPAPDVFSRLQQALPQMMDNFRLEEQTENSIKARGALRLRTPHHIIRTVDYTLKIRSTEEGYEYLIDSVLFTERERGEKAKTRPSDVVLEGMDETGKIVGEVEKILNETDMKIQRLLALLRKEAGG